MPPRMGCIFHFGLIAALSKIGRMNRACRFQVWSGSGVTPRRSRTLHASGCSRRSFASETRSGHESANSLSQYYLEYSTTWHDVNSVNACEFGSENRVACLRCGWTLLGGEQKLSLESVKVHQPPHQLTRPSGSILEALHCRLNFAGVSY